MNDKEKMIAFLNDSVDSERFLGFLEAVKEKRSFAACIAGAEIIVALIPSVRRGTAIGFMATILLPTSDLETGAALLYDLLINRRLMEAVAETDAAIFGLN